MKIRTICNLLSRKVLHLVCTVIKRKSPDFKSYGCYLNTDNKQVTKAIELRSVVARKKRKEKRNDECRVKARKYIIKENAKSDGCREKREKRLAVVLEEEVQDVMMSQ